MSVYTVHNINKRTTQQKNQLYKQSAYEIYNLGIPKRDTKYISTI
jgi:hypothetical protein